MSSIYEFVKQARDSYQSNTIEVTDGYLLERWGWCNVFKRLRRGATDIASFRPIRPAERPIESEIEAILEVIAPVFKGEGVWRFKYG